MALSEKSQIIIENIVAIAVVTFIGSLVTTMIPFKYIIGVLWSVPIVILIKRYNFFNGALAILVSSILNIYNGVNIDYLIFLLQFAPLTLVIGFNIKKNFSFAKGMLLVFAVSLLINGSLVFATINETKAEINDLQNKLQINVDSTVKLFDQQGILKQYEKMGIDEKVVRDTLIYENILLRQILILLPGILTINYMVTLFIIYLIGYRFFGRSSASLSFIAWHVPWYFIWLVILSLGTVMLGDHFHIKTLFISGLNFLVVIAPLFLTVGFSVITYFIKKWKPAVMGKILILLIILSSPQLVILLALLLGVFDPYFDFRGLSKGKGSVSGG